MGGSEQTIPVHAAVKTLLRSPSPLVTSAGGAGASRVPGFQLILGIISPCCFQKRRKDPAGRSADVLNNPLLQVGKLPCL